MQDRLIKGLRIAKACTLDAANEYLDRVFLPMWNRRFRQDPASDIDAHRPLGPTLDLDSILSSSVDAPDWYARSGNGGRRRRKEVLPIARLLNLDSNAAKASALLQILTTGCVPKVQQKQK